MQTTISDALTASGFVEEDVLLLTEAEKDFGPVQNWPEARFTEILDAIKGLAAFSIVRASKVATVSRQGERAVLPEKPPYLSVDRNGVPVGYDSTDPSQYWTDPGTAELWRWDGKRAQPLAGKKDEAGRVIPEQPYPYGKPHRVMLVSHMSVDGIAVPDPRQQAEADAKGYDWFHQGYGTWIGNGGKPYRDVPVELSRQVRAARERVFSGGNPAIVRA